MAEIESERISSIHGFILKMVSTVLGQAERRDKELHPDLFHIGGSGLILKPLYSFLGTIA